MHHFLPEKMSDTFYECDISISYFCEKAFMTKGREMELRGAWELCGPFQGGVLQGDVVRLLSGVVTYLLFATTTSLEKRPCNWKVYASVNCL